MDALVCELWLSWLLLIRLWSGNQPHGHHLEAC